MKVILEKRPKSPIIVEGFPGFGLIGTISTEFLIKHLDARLIGRIRVEEVPPIIAVHDGGAVEPVGIYYAAKQNIIIIHALSALNNLEWELSELILRLAKDLKAKELISIEGVGSQTEVQDPRIFHVSNNKSSKRTKAAPTEPLQEGIIVGVTGALLLSKGVPITCFFAETHSALPDSRAAANIIKVLDKYLGLKVDYKPLIAKAEKFESKLREFLTKAKDVSAEKNKNSPTYFG